MNGRERARTAGFCLVWMLFVGLLAPPCWAADRALYWEISQAGEPRGFLLGTIHSEDPRVLDFSPGFLQGLSENRVFAMELVPDLATLTQLSRRMLLPDDTRLEQLVGTERFAAVSRALEPYGVPRAQLDRLQPWAAVMTLSVPPPETGLFMDFSLSLRASGSGLRVVGLETLDEQLAFLEGMSMPQQLQLLDHAVAEASRVETVHDEMVESYLANDLAGLQRQAMTQLDTLERDVRAVFVDEGIAERNRRMLGAILPLLEEGGVFIAVGALHLPEEYGLLALLRAAGYSLEPAGWPFNASP